MRKNESDTFEPAQSLSTGNGQSYDKNFFLKDDLSALANFTIPNLEPTRHINDYDYNLLKEDAYKDVDDEVLKLEYKLSLIENEIKSIENQIKSAQEINDFILLNDLKKQNGIAKAKYVELLDLYNSKKISGKLSGAIIKTIEKPIANTLNMLDSKVSSIREKLLSKLPKRLLSVLELKKSLNKLENINKRVDDLMTLNIPYGENVDKYNQLSKYIVKANIIHSEIKKYLK